MIYRRCIYVTHRQSNSNPRMESFNMSWFWIIRALSLCSLPASNLFVDGSSQALFACTCGPQRTYSGIFQPCCIPHMRKGEKVRRLRHLSARVTESSALNMVLKLKAVQNRRELRGPWSDIRMATSCSPATIVTCTGGREGSCKCLAWVASIDC